MAGKMRMNIKDKTFTLFLYLFLVVFSATPSNLINAAQVETPDSFVARKKSSYSKALEELKAQYRKWCVVAGRPVIQVGPGEADWEAVKKGMEQEKGGMVQVKTPGLVGEGEFYYSYEIEQVYNTWYSGGTGNNPYLWQDVTYAFQPAQKKSSDIKGDDQCSNKFMSFDTTAPGGPYAGIILDPATNSCKLTKFDPSKSSSVWFNALNGNYQFGPDAPAWSGPINLNATYNNFYSDLLYTHTSGKKVSITFKVSIRDPSKPNEALLIVGKVIWK